jgi:hypothetical protein
MSTKDPNLKVIFGADTKDFDKGAKDVKQGLKDLDKTGTQALESLGSAFGVDTRKINQMTSAMKGLGEKLSQTGNAGVKAFGDILKAVGPVGGAIAGLGLSAAIAGFRELQKEADAFKNTVAGANYEMATAAYVDTYKQILRDFNGDVGKSIAETESKWKKFWGTIGITMRELLTTGAWQGTNTPGGAEALNEYTRRIAAANEGGQKAQELTNQIYQLERKRKENAVELAKLNDDIADQLLVAKDTSKSVQERQDAIYKAELMQSQKRTLTVELEKKLSDLYKERSALASDSVEAADATLAQETRAYEVSRAMTQEEISLLRVKSSIGKASEAEIARMNQLIKQQKELQATIDATHAKWASMSEGLGGLSGVNSPNLPGVSGPAMSIIPRIENVEYFKDTLTAQLGDITIGIGLKADTKNIQDISNEIESLLSSSITRTSELIGNLVGTLAGGGDAWGDFKSAALSAFGDMAIAVGKIAIASGIASEGIQAALKMENPYVAIAAGAALIALGSAVKSSLSAVASGDYSASGGGYSSGGYSSGGNNYETRDVYVNVTGTLTADGDQLKAVLNNVDRKDYLTT